MFCGYGQHGDGKTPPCESKATSILRLDFTGLPILVDDVPGKDLGVVTRQLCQTHLDLWVTAVGPKFPDRYRVIDVASLEA